MKTRLSKPFFLSWLPALLGMGVLFYTSSLPGDKVRLPPFPYSDNAVHFSAYAVLGMLIAPRRPLRRRISEGASGAREKARPDAAEAAPEGSGRIDYVGRAVGMFYGVGDEIHQLYVPDRSYDYADMAADAAGVLVGCWVFGKLMKRFEDSRDLVRADLIEERM